MLKMVIYSNMNDDRGMSLGSEPGLDMNRRKGVGLAFPTASSPAAPTATISGIKWSS